MTKGKFISIEGIEGAGKTTAMQSVQSFLQARDINVVTTREPGGTPLAEEIRQLLLFPNSNEKMAADTELLLMFAGRAQHLQACILPNLNAGKWVLSDRFVDASFAYQGGGRGVDVAKISQLQTLVVGQAMPDLTLLLDLPAEVGVARAASRHAAQDRIEAEKIEFFLRVRAAYLQRAQAEPKRIKIINAELPLAQVTAQITIALTKFLESDT